MKKVWVVVITLLCCILATSGQEVDPNLKACKVSSKPIVKYELVSAGVGLGKSPVVGLRIVVADKFFNRLQMELLVKQLGEKYCNATELGVTIFDDKKTAQNARVVVEHLSGKRVVPQIRGFYSANKSTGLSKLEFSTKRGNPTNEITLDLSSSP